MSSFHWSEVRDQLERIKTPFYAYDLSCIRDNFLKLRQALPERFSIFYSMKANPHDRVLRLMRELGAWADVSSQEEMNRALRAHFTAQQLSFIGPGKSDDELRSCIEGQVFCIVAESIPELWRVQKLAHQLGQTARVCIRVNPCSYIHHSGAQKKEVPNHFGLDEEKLDEAIRVLRDCSSIQLVGLHFYLHSQFLRAPDIVVNFQSFLGIAVRFRSLWGQDLEVLNFGGGFGIPYFDNQHELDLAALRVGFSELARSSEANQLSNTKFFVESGRFLVGPSGVFVTRILDRKESRGKIFLICDGGMTQHLAAIGVGQVIRRHYPIQILRPMLSNGSSDTLEKLETVCIAGPSCYSLDILADEIQLPHAEPGDLICIEQSGAYGATFSPQGFLSRPAPQEIFIGEEAP